MAQAESTPAVATTARRYAQRLLTSLGARPLRELAIEDEHPALAWARCGMMQLTGAAEGAPQMCPAPLAACADGALAAIAALAPANAFRDALDVAPKEASIDAPGDIFSGLRGSQLLSERAALAGLQRRGSIAPGGSCRLLAAVDGRLAVNLARDEDWALLPAWLEMPGALNGRDQNWPMVAERVAARRCDELVERARLLGLAVCADALTSIAAVDWRTVTQRGTRLPAPRRRAPRVVDLSSLWAGPLCGHLLHTLGAEVIKVESRRRPDGARRGPAAFFDLLNAGKRSVGLDFGSACGIDQLRALLAQADIVIEASRPRALRQLGIDAEALVRAQPGLSWISISGYGRGQPQEDWIAFGDDAGVAAGLSRMMFDATGERLIVGDAIADPLTGLHAALAAWASWLDGGGRLISLALSEVVAHCLAFDGCADRSALLARQRDWSGRGGMLDAEPRPAPRRVPAAARPFGADTANVLAEWARME